MSQGPMYLQFWIVTKLKSSQGPQERKAEFHNIHSFCEVLPGPRCRAHDEF